jgi:hypothetical protein
MSIKCSYENIFTSSIIIFVRMIANGLGVCILHHYRLYCKSIAVAINTQNLINSCESSGNSSENNSSAFEILLYHRDILINTQISRYG